MGIYIIILFLGLIFTMSERSPYFLLGAFIISFLISLKKTFNLEEKIKTNEELIVSSKTSMALMNDRIKSLETSMSSLKSSSQISPEPTSPLLITQPIEVIKNTAEEPVKEAVEVTAQERVKEKAEITIETPVEENNDVPVEIPAEEKLEIPAEKPSEEQIETISETLSEVKEEKIETVRETPREIPTHPASTQPFKQEETSPTKFEQTWDKLQHQFIQNWTGILGSIITVMGVGFLGVYTALKLSPIFRFAGIILIAAVLFGLFIYLKKSDRMLQLALWLRSSAGAIFLFACFAGGNVPAIQWIDSKHHIQALLLLCTGILVNLILAYVGKKQVFASLHVLLSLVMLSIVTPIYLTFIIAALITLFGVALTYREKWEYHLLLTISLFFLYNFYAFNSFPTQLFSPFHHKIGFIGVFSVSLLALFVHYRDLYKSQKFEPLPFTVHLVNWVYLATGLLQHSLNSPLKPVFISVGAILSFILARRAKKLGIRWLYLTDTLVAQTIALLAIFTTHVWGVHGQIRASLMLLETLIYLYYISKQEENLLTKTGIILQYIIALFSILIDVRTVHQNVEIRSYISFISSPVLLQSLFSILLCMMFSSIFYFKQLKPAQLKNVTEPQKMPSIYGDSLWLSLLLAFPFYLFSLASIYFVKNFHNVHYPKYIFGAIAFISILGFILANQARKFRDYNSSISTGIYRFGSIVSQLLAIISILFLRENWFDFFSIVFLETILFLLLVNYQEDKKLNNLGIKLLYFATAGFPVSLSLEIGVYSKWNHPSDLFYKLSSLQLKHLTWFLVMITAITLYHIYSLKKYGEKHQAFPFKSSDAEKGIPISSIGFLAGILLIFSFAHMNDILGITFILSTVGIILLCVNKKIKSNGLGFGLYTAVFFSYVFGLYNISMGEKIYGDFYFYAYPFRSFLFTIPYLILTLTAILTPFISPYKYRVKAIFIYLFYFQLILAADYCLISIFPYMPGYIFLVLSVITLEIVIFSRKWMARMGIEKGESDKPLLNSGLFLLLIFLLQHLAIHIPTQINTPGLNLNRLAVSIVGILTFIYWFSRMKSNIIEIRKLYPNVNPLFFDLILFFATLTVAVEAPQKYLPLIWIIAAILALIAGRNSQGQFSRTRFYSYIFFFLSNFCLVYNHIDWNDTHSNAYTILRITDIAAVLLQYIFITIIHKLPFLENITFPKHLEPLAKFTNHLKNNQNLYLNYPLFISTAIYLYRTFDKSLLTFLWVLEIFIIFIISIILRDNHFRYVSMTALAFAIGRIIFYDLAKSDTITRALVFMGVGMIMLGMNYIFRKYKDRA